MKIFRSKSAKQEISQLELTPSNEPGAKSGLAFVAIVKDEADAIIEWIQFHLAAGVDHFFFYDDGSTDETVTNIRKTLSMDKYTLTPWKQRLKDAKSPKTIHNQPLAYAHAVSNYGASYRWMGFFDIDEFLFPVDADSICEVLDDLKFADTILIPWTMFGRNGHEITPKTIIPNFTERMRDPFASTVSGLMNFKCLVNPSVVTKVYNHGFETNGNQTLYNTAGVRFTFGQHQNSNFQSNSKLQLNHYYAKSDEQMAQKIAKGSIGFSKFTASFKTVDSRSRMLTRRVREIERDVVTDVGIQTYCERIGFGSQTTAKE